MLTLAFRNILRNKRRSLLTLLSMGGGYFLLCITLSMSEGSYSNIIDIFTRDHTGHVQIHADDYLTRPSLYKTINNAESLMAKLEKNEEVVGIAPRIYGPSLAYGKNKTFPAQVIGINPTREAKTTRLKDKVKQGHYFTRKKTKQISEKVTEQLSESDYAPAMIGYSLAKNLKLTLGDDLVLISQGIDGSVANDIFEVIAIVGSVDSFERNNVYLTLSAMQQFLSMGNQVHELAIALEHQSDARSFVKRMAKRIAKQNSTAIPKNSVSNNLSIEPWQVVEAGFYNGMQADKQGSYISMAIIIFIVSIGVLNTVLMGTLERTREFGVLKAIGTKPSALFSLIMLESFFLAMISSLAGLILALPVNYWLSTVGISMPEPIDMGGIRFDSMMGEISWYTILLPFAVVIFSTLLVSLYPSIRAAKISPLKALQAV